MGIDSKLILEHSKNLNLLYVEDNDTLREATKKIFSHYFRHVDEAVDGQDGLDKYHLYKQHSGDYYDLVISDINMPHVNGIEMSKAMVAVNPSQSVIFITAHDEVSFLHEAIALGADGFLHKPLNPDQLKVLLYKTTLAIADRKLVEDLHIKLLEQNEEIHKEKEKLEEQIRLLKMQVNATNVKHQQLGELLEQQHKEFSDPVLDDYFSKDTDEGDENVLFMRDDCDELFELFNELPELMIQYNINSDITNIHKIVEGLKKVSLILYHYTPFLDSLAESFEELSSTIMNNMDDFIKMYKQSPDNAIMLFDAISVDMDRYMNRFSVESMAMKNIHHIHHPTTLSIKQIIGLISPDNIDEGEIDFFI